MSKAKEVKDIAFLTALGIGGAGVSAWLIRKIPGSGGEMLSPKTRAMIQVGAGLAIALFTPSRMRIIKLAGGGMVFAGTYSLAENMGFKMLAGPRRGSSLTKEQILYLQTTGRAPAMSGPMDMRRMSGPMDMRRMGASQPTFMGAGKNPGMMGFSKSVSTFKASC